MNRRGFLKMLGIAVPAVVIAPIVVAESTPEFQMGYGSSYPGMPLSRGPALYRTEPLFWRPFDGPEFVNGSAMVKASAMVHRIDEKTNTVFLIPVEGR